MSDNTALGDRQKLLESSQCGHKTMPILPTLARLDGKNFSNLTRNFKRPYDETMSELMIKLTEYLAEETNTRCAYTQSDEITLLWHSENYKSQIFFDGRIQKMVSVLASMATLYFNNMFRESSLPKNKTPALFDCRVWTLPTRWEAANAFLWRERDCTKNSLTMAAQEFYSHRELDNKNSSEKHELLFLKGKNWATDYPDHFKRGTYVRKVTKTFEVTPEHRKLGAAATYERAIFQRQTLPPLDWLVNREEVIFDNAEPEQKKES